MQLPYPVVLASASPRRCELLAELLGSFEVVPAAVDEDALTTDDPWETAKRLAVAKAAYVFADRQDALVIAGDTVVAVELEQGWMQLAKPADAAEAHVMLRLLSGRTHIVVTGVALAWPGGTSSFTETSRVTFRKLTKKQIESYVATGSPFDKAGAYGLQDESQDFIARVDGSVTNVIGLPMEKLETALASLAR